MGYEHELPHPNRAKHARERLFEPEEIEIVYGSGEIEPEYYLRPIYFELVKVRDPIHGPGKRWRSLETGEVLPLPTASPRPDPDRLP